MIDGWNLIVSSIVRASLMSEARGQHRTPGVETAVIVTLPMLPPGSRRRRQHLPDGDVDSDNVLAFIPRAAAIFIVFALTFPWMLRVVTGFAGALIHRLPELVR